MEIHSFLLAALAMFDFILCLFLSAWKEWLVIQISFGKRKYINLHLVQTTVMVVNLLSLTKSKKCVPALHCFLDFLKDHLSSKINQAYNEDAIDEQKTEGENVL